MAFPSGSLIAMTHSPEIGAEMRLRKTGAERLSCKFGTEIRHENSAPIWTLLYSKPESDVKCDTWLVTDQCLHFRLLSSIAYF